MSSYDSCSESFTTIGESSRAIINKHKRTARLAFLGKIMPSLRKFKIS